MNPLYYQELGMEVYEIIGKILEREGLVESGLEPQSFADLSNILKYLLRLGSKGDAIVDLGKAQWYLKKLMEREDGFMPQEEVETYEEPRDEDTVAAKGNPTAGTFSFSWDQGAIDDVPEGAPAARGRVKVCEFGS